MRRGPARTALALGCALLAAPAAAPAAGPAGSLVCQRPCPECVAGRDGDPDLECETDRVTCRANVAFCETKLAVYRTQMANLGSGVELFPLPEATRRTLARFYPQLDLAAVRIGASQRQPLENAITDCDRIYFQRASFVDDVRAERVREDADLRWLLHELRHAEQCAELGGRDAYAARWIDELGTTLISEIDLTTVHDHLPMEDDANRRADEVLKQLAACCRAPDGRLAAPRPEAARP